MAPARSTRLCTIGSCSSSLLSRSSPATTCRSSPVALPVVAGLRPVRGPGPGAVVVGVDVGAESVGHGRPAEHGGPRHRGHPGGQRVVDPHAREVAGGGARVRHRQRVGESVARADGGGGRDRRGLRELHAQRAIDVGVEHPVPGVEGLGDAPDAAGPHGLDLIPAEGTHREGGRGAGREGDGDALVGEQVAQQARSPGQVRQGHGGIGRGPRDLGQVGKGDGGAVVVVGPEGGQGVDDAQGVDVELVRLHDQGVGDGGRSRDGRDEHGARGLVDGQGQLHPVFRTGQDGVPEVRSPRRRWPCAGFSP